MLSGSAVFEGIVAKRRELWDRSGQLKDWVP